MRLSRIVMINKTRQPSRMFAQGPDLLGTALRGEAFLSVFKLDAGPETLECRQRFQGPANRAPQPEPARLSHDQHVPPSDSDLDRSDSIAQQFADLALDPALDGRVGAGLWRGIDPVPWPRFAA
jgi:hypothetical protein